MKRNVLKQLVCILGMVFMTFPAWSAVPAQLLPDNGNLNQTQLFDDFEGGMMLAKSGNSGGGGGQGGNDGSGQGGSDSGGPNGSGDGTCDNCDGEPDQLREQKQLQEQEQLQQQLQVQEQLQVQIGEPLYLHNQEKAGAGNGGSDQ
jgi:hypothetical protein